MLKLRRADHSQIQVNLKSGMNVQTAYNQWSAAYDADRNVTRDLDHAVMQQTVQNLSCAAILEMGCGTGKNTALLTKVGKTVLALDFSEGMLSKAREKVTASHVRFALADLTRPWPVADQAFDLIACNLVLEHIQDLSFVFAQAARSLRAGGHFFVCELHPAKQYLGSQARFEHAQGITLIPVHLHHLTDFTQAAEQNGLALQQLREWWHADDDRQKQPRLVSFMFSKQ
jgi:malonyl-CoA O-methyltransferase